MKVSVVVATYNRQGSLRRLLQQLSEQTLPASDFEVCVVDDGSAVPIYGPPDWTGPWHVEVRDASGTVLKRIDFTVGQ